MKTRQEWKDHVYTLAGRLATWGHKIAWLGWDAHGGVVDCGKDPMHALLEIRDLAKAVVAEAEEAITELALQQKVKRPQ